MCFCFDILSLFLKHIFKIKNHNRYFHCAKSPLYIHCGDVLEFIDISDFAHTYGMLIADIIGGYLMNLFSFRSMYKSGVFDNMFDRELSRSIWDVLNQKWFCLTEYVPSRFFWYQVYLSYRNEDEGKSFLKVHKKKMILIGVFLAIVITILSVVTIIALEFI